ncbi:MAG: hypothetical protein ACHP7M_03820 [Burkholderiales bacterium]
MKTTLAVVLALLCVGCADIPDQGDTPRAAKEYTTGSNIPTRDHHASDVRTVDAETAAREMQVRVPSVKAQ